MKFARNVSKQPRKKRKQRYCAPLHAASKFLHANLSKELRKKLGRRSALVRRGDTVKLMRGAHRKKTGKVAEVDYKRHAVFVEGITMQGRKSKTRSFVPLDASNLQITDKFAGKAKKPAKQAVAPAAGKEKEKPAGRIERQEGPAAAATAEAAEQRKGETAKEKATEAADKTQEKKPERAAEAADKTQ